MTEGELQHEVVKLASDLGLLVHHCPDARRCYGQGLPDLIIAGPGGVIFRELKSDDGETTAQQDLWGWTLSRGGASWAVWRPADWCSGAISSMLEKLSRERRPRP